jgi:hypothetical protein
MIDLLKIIIKNQVKIIILLALLVLVSCSDKSTINSSNEAINDEITFEALSVRTSLINGINSIPQSSLDFASLQSNQIANQDLIITNGLSSELIFSSNDIDSSSISPFILVEDCSNKSIARNRSCKLKFSIKNVPSATSTVLTKSLTIKGVVVQLTATLEADQSNPNAPISGITVSPVNLNFGFMKDGQVKDLSIVISNKTQSPQNISPPTISHPKMSIISNTCSNLDRSRSCSMKIRYTASSDENISQDSVTSIANNNIQYSVLVQSPTINQPQVLTINPINAQQSTVAINEPQIQSSILTFTNTGLVELPPPVELVAQPSNGVIVNSVSCSGGLSRGRTCSVLYSLNSSILPNGQSQIDLKLQSGTLASSSHSLTVNVTKITVACSPLDAQKNGWNVNDHATISGMKVGNDVSQCNINSCNQYYSINSQTKSCDPIICSLENSETYGINLTNVSAVSGNIPNCSIASCSNSSLYNISNDQKSCTPKLCNELNSSDLITLGFNITNATVSGTYPSCSLSCNSVFQQLAGDEKSCVDKIPSGSISFDQDYTKNLSGNILNITHTNAQQIQFYSDSSCSNPINSPIALPLTQTEITLSSGDGAKNAYAKLINGLASSSCLNDSIILDTASNYSLVSSGIVNKTISPSLSISGVCEESSGNTLAYQFLNLSDSIISSANIICTNSEYDLSLNVPVGVEKIKVLAEDKAGNLFQSSVDVLVFSSLSFDSNSINSDADSGFTKNSSITLNLSSAENSKQMIVSNSNTCSGSFSSFSSSVSHPLTLNSLNTIYVKLKNRTTESSCLQVGSITHDSINPILGNLSFTLKEYGESNSTPNFSIAPTTEINIKKLQYSISSDNVSDNIRAWTDLAANTSSHVGSATMTNRALYYYRLRAFDKAGNVSSISSLQFKHYDIYPYLPLKSDGSGNMILDNGLAKTNYLYDFAKQASTSNVREEFSGIYSLKHQDTVVSTELVSYETGTHNARNYCNSTTDIMCMVRFNGNVVLNGLHIPQVRKKGFVIFVDGNLTINSGATISMTARGALSSGQQVFIHPLASISPNGGNGGAAYTTTVAATATSYANNGLVGTEGAAGGGAAGGAGRNSTSWTAIGGAGAAGTSWSGGSGGGNAGSRNGSCTAGNAVANGGAGGNGCATGVAFRDWAAGGGAGNPGGNGSNGGTAGATGTGGTLIIFVRGNVINNGTIEARGLQSNEGGGASGGGSLTLIYDGSYSGSGTTNVTGGAASTGFGGGVSGVGGNGSSRLIQANIDDYVTTSCNAIKIAYPSAVNGTYLIDSDGELGPNPIVPVFCDMVTDGGGWTKLIGDASESSAAMKTYIQNISDYSTVQTTATWTNNSSYGFKIYNITNGEYNCIDFDYAPSFTQLKFNFWGYYNNPAGGMGVMQVASGDSSGVTNPYLVYFRDAWTGSSNGQDYWLNGVQINDKQQIDRVNVPYARTFTSPQTFVRLCFSSYNGYPEDYQGVRNMYVK